MKRKFIIIPVAILAVVIWGGYIGVWHGGKRFLEERRIDKEERQLAARKQQLDDEVTRFISTQRLPVPSDADMVYWQNQSWETGGGFCRLTLWSDGRSELLVGPDGYIEKKTLRPKIGWSKRGSDHDIVFVRTEVFPAEETKRIFGIVWNLGVQHIRPFEANYVDGGGTVIATQIAGKLSTVVVPMFPEEQMFSEEHVRYLAVSKHIGMFGLGEMAYERNTDSQQTPAGDALKATPEE